MRIILTVAGGFWERKIPTSNTSVSGRDARKGAATCGYATPLFGSAATAMFSIVLRLLQPISRAELCIMHFLDFSCLVLGIFSP